MSGIIRGDKPNDNTQQQQAQQQQQQQQQAQQQQGFGGSFDQPQQTQPRQYDTAKYLGNLFSGAQLGRTESGAVLTNAVEAIKKFLEEKGMAKDTNRDGMEYRVIGIDSNEINSYASAVSLVAIDRNVTPIRAYAHTMVLAASQSEEIQSTTVNIGNSSVEVQQTLHDIIDNNFRNKVKDLIAPNLYLSEACDLYDAGFTIIPKEVTLNDDTKENQELLNARIFYASTSIRSLRAEISGMTSLDLTQMPDAQLVIREDITPATPVYDANGNPVRTDVRVTSSIQFKDTDDRQRSVVLTDVSAAISLAYQPTNQGYNPVVPGVDAYGKPVVNQDWIPTFTITRNDTGTPNVTLAQNLLGIAIAAYTLGSSLHWANVFYMNRTKPHLDLGSLPVMKGDQPVTDLASADTDINTFLGVVGFHVRENPVILYHVDRFDELASTNDVLLMAASGDTGALDNIYQELNDLCGQKLGDIIKREDFTANMVGFLQPRQVPLGTYVPSNDGVAHDRREIDMLSVLSRGIPNADSIAKEIYIADNNPNLPINYRYNDRCKLDAAITASSLTNHGYAYEIVLSTQFLELLIGVIKLSKITVQRRYDNAVNNDRSFFNQALANNAVKAGLGQSLINTNFGGFNQPNQPNQMFNFGNRGW